MTSEICLHAIEYVHCLKFVRLLNVCHGIVFSLYFVVHVCVLFSLKLEESG